MVQGQQSRERVSDRIDSSARRGLVNGNGLTNGQGKTNGRGMTNGRGISNGRGMTNGKGRTNGLVNGLGRTNGNGLTNGLTNGRGRGNGFVNGRGLVNGVRVPLRINPFGVVTHKDIRIGISLAVLFVLLLPSFYLMFSVRPPSAPAMQIDGAFNDWRDIPAYTDNASGPNPNVAFAQYATVQADENIFVYLRVAGQLFNEAQGYDGFYAFVDTDGNQNTGYWPGSLGAEYAASIYGGDNKISGAELMMFESAGDPLNWSAWKGVSGIPASFSSSSLEFAMPTSGMSLNEDYRLRLAANDFQGHAGLASIRIGDDFGALRVEQSPARLTDALTPTNNQILHLKFMGFGRKVVISDLPAMTSWESYPSSLRNQIQLTNQLVLDPGDVEELDVGVVDFAGLPSKKPVWLNLTEVQSDAPVTLEGSGGVGYVNEVPQDKAVDGWFGDWLTGLQSDPSPPLANPNVDVAAYSSNITQYGGQGRAFFYIGFRGTAMGGDPTPAKVVWTGVGQASPPSTPKPLRRIAGQDRLVVYVDVNTTDSLGCSEGGLLSDYELEFRGHRGRIDSVAFYACSGGGWVPRPGVVPRAMMSGSEFETSIDLTVLGTLSSPMVIVESTDWSGFGDMPPTIDLDTRSRGERGDSRSRGGDFPGILSNPPGVDQVTSLPLSVDPSLDGRCDDAAYDGASEEDNASFRFWVGHKDGWVWFCVIVIDHTTNNLDLTELMFDTMHNGTSAPQIDDRLFARAASVGPLGRFRGDGNGWVECDMGSCSPGDDGQYSFWNNNETYEFKINQLNVWNTNNPSGRAGFAIHMHDDNSVGADYYWGSWSVDRTSPETWGHLDIPEFPMIVIPVLSVIALMRFRRKRRRA